MVKTKPPPNTITVEFSVTRSEEIKTRKRAKHHPETSPAGTFRVVEEGAEVEEQ